jgi:hypothetical protein
MALPTVKAFAFAIPTERLFLPSFRASELRRAFFKCIHEFALAITRFDVWQGSSGAATIGMRATKFANEGEGAAWYASNEAVGLGRAVSFSFSFFGPPVFFSPASSSASASGL